MTDGNKAEYVSAKARLVLVGSREPALEAIKRGFAGALKDLSPGAAPFMGLLSHADWRVLLCGEEHVSGPQVGAPCTCEGEWRGGWLCLRTLAVGSMVDHIDCVGDALRSDWSERFLIAG